MRDTVCLTIVCAEQYIYMYTVHTECSLNTLVSATTHALCKMVHLYLHICNYFIVFLSLFCHCSRYSFLTRCPLHLWMNTCNIHDRDLIHVHVYSQHNPSRIRTMYKYYMCIKFKGQSAPIAIHQQRICKCVAHLIILHTWSASWRLVWWLDRASCTAFSSKTYW